MQKILLILGMLALCLGCKKGSPTYWFNGMEIIDSNGNFSRWYGSADNDWQINKYTISPTVLNAMMPDTSKDTASWHGTQIGNVAVVPGPNPVAVDTGTFNYYFQVYFHSKAYCNYMLCDEYGTIIYKNQCWGENGTVYYLNIPLNNTQVTTGNVYRLYYAFSSVGNIFFATGWGDIGFCSKDATTLKASACF